MRAGGRQLEGEARAAWQLRDGRCRSPGTGGSTTQGRDWREEGGHCFSLAVLQLKEGQESPAAAGRGQ
eukprot:2614037-Prorocentrum_lima.AAC.1